MTSVYPDLSAYKTARDAVIANEETTKDDLNKFDKRFTGDIKEDYKAAVRKIVITIKANQVLLDNLIRATKDKNLTNENYVSLLDTHSALDKAKQKIFFLIDQDESLYKNKNIVDKSTLKASLEMQKNLNFMAKSENIKGWNY